MSRKDGISQGAMDGGAIYEPKDGLEKESTQKRINPN
jgi:hypothetical protein